MQTKKINNNKINEEVTSDENEFIQKLHDIVQKTIQEEDLILNNLLHPTKETLTPSQKISDRVAQFGGSWKFIISCSVVLAIWITYNVNVKSSEAFDPYPFILMNLILSCIAALQAPIIMMSQNRKEEKDRMRSENDYLINLKAEMGVRSLHQKMDLLLGDQIKKLYDLQGVQLNMLQEINKKLDENHQTKR
ncbi:putative membrane protein [Pedobacter sp. CG_S7]|uniref:DUF1003 domain-containing protein n=1 Tax=Pedobacter sp. CG_S7 TaxID=3143930 RepID=UPI00339313A3